MPGACNLEPTILVRMRVSENSHHRSCAVTVRTLGSNRRLQGCAAQPRMYAGKSTLVVSYLKRTHLFEAKLKFTRCEMCSVINTTLLRYPRIVALLNTDYIRGPPT